MLITLFLSVVQEYTFKATQDLRHESEGLKTFYCSNIRSLLTYAAPAWFTLLGDTDSNRLEKVQRTATQVILHYQEYDDRLEMLSLPTLARFLLELSQRNLVK